MNFYNRENELGRLQQLVDLGREEAHFVVVTGRRRIGKTEMVRHFFEGRSDFVYLFVGKKKTQVLLDEFTEILSERIPLLKMTSVKSFDALFTIIFQEMVNSPLYLVLDEFQNFQQVDNSIYSILQNLWDQYKSKCKGAIICIGSVQTLMRDIFEGSKEPLFGRATAKMHLKPLSVDVITSILTDNGVDPARYLLHFHSLFGGVPKYYFLIHRHRLFKKGIAEIISSLFCMPDALLQNEGRELLIEEFGKNYHLYFSILQVMARGETQMMRIADASGIGVNSISKYLDELVNYYQVIERRTPVTASGAEQKNGRYHISDPLLKFWFRYIHRNQSLVALGATGQLTAKIMADLSTYMGWSFELLIRDILIVRNNGIVLPFVFERIGGWWNRTGDVELDIVALAEECNSVFFGECKLDGNKFSVEDAKRFKEKAKSVKWGRVSRIEHFALFSYADLTQSTVQRLKKEGITCFQLAGMIRHSG